MYKEDSLSEWLSERANKKVSLKVSGFLDSADDSFVYDPVDTRLSELQKEMEEWPNDIAKSQALWVLPFGLGLQQSSFH